VALFSVRPQAYIRPSSRGRWRRRLAPSSAGARLSKLNFMTDDADRRRRRAVYRACHRGTKEMDWILGRFAERSVGDMPPDQLDLFERMLSLPDPDLQDMVLHPEFAPAGEFGELVMALRVFHGLESAP
jgi:antitoxin CptB